MYSSVCAVIVTLGLERHQGPALFGPISDGWLDLLWEHCTFNCFCICDCLCGCLCVCLFSHLYDICSRHFPMAGCTFLCLCTSSFSAPQTPCHHFCSRANFSVFSMKTFQCSKMFKSSFCLKDPPPHFLQYLNLSVQ